MKKFYVFVFYLFALFYLEIVYKLLVFESFLTTSIINIFLFLIPIAALLTFCTGIFKNTGNKVISYVVFSILGAWFSLEFVFKKVFAMFFSLSLFSLSDQVVDFGKQAVVEILKCSYGILLFFVPLVLVILYRNKLGLVRNKIVESIALFGLILVSVGSFMLYVSNSGKETYSARTLYCDINEVSLNIEHLGVINAGFLDFERTLLGFEEKITIAKLEKEETGEEEIFKYDDNSIDIDFKKLSTSGTSDQKTIDKFMLNEEATKQNKYTGIFKGKNLVYIVAESFSSIAVDEERTPTLYKLVNSGFSFENFYTPNNLSTIGGEFQALTGLFADNTILSTWRSGRNTFPYGLGTTFKNLGYNAYAYHNNSYTFQDRYIYLRSMGLENFKACKNGMERLINCNIWPQSDDDMIKATISDYVNSDNPFLAYYMTVSGHFGYDWSNSMAKKWKSSTVNLDYSEETKAYLATQVELDRSLATLIAELEKAGKLDDTVIVLLADHYPYKLTTEQINEASTYKRDSVVEINHNNLIIWNNKLNTVKVEKTAMSIDVIPTVYNLFGIEYDSRLFVGKDILSTEPGLAIFKNRSWVSDKGTFYASNGKFVARGNEEVDQNYINTMNQIVANKLNISRLIVSSDYYKHVFK